MDCLFCKIIKREIPAAIVYEDDICIAFNDISPQAPFHILVIPKEHFAGLNEADESHEKIMGHCLRTCATVARQVGIYDNGFRTVINTGKDAQQSVFHLHIHLLGGKGMNWNPA